MTRQEPRLSRFLETSYAKALEQYRSWLAFARRISSVAINPPADRKLSETKPEVVLSIDSQRPFVVMRKGALHRAFNSLLAALEIIEEGVPAWLGWTGLLEVFPLACHRLIRTASKVRSVVLTICARGKEKPMIAQLDRLYRSQIDVLTHAQPFLLFVIRAYWGFQFLLTGRGKLMNIENTTEFFTSLNIPMPMLSAYMAGTTEFLGGLCLLIGCASRLSAIPLIGTMLGAYATAHVNELYSLFSDPDVFVSAPPFQFLLASVIVLIFGPGWISIDGLIQRFAGHDCKQSEPSRVSTTPAVMVGNSTI